MEKSADKFPPALVAGNSDVFIMPDLTAVKPVRDDVRRVAARGKHESPGLYFNRGAFTACAAPKCPADGFLYD